MRKKYLVALGGGIFVLLIAGGGVAMAATGHMGFRNMTPPAAMGTVQSVSGSTITLTSKNGTTYTVNAANATITKITPGTGGTKPTKSTITVSAIANGDTVTVFGTASGDSITATTITDGLGGFGGGRVKMKMPAAAGTVTAVSGNTITLSDSRNSTTYTVDATSATINKFTPGSSGQKPTSTTITVSQIAVGDNLMVFGTVSGSNITATQITDGQFMGGMGMGAHAKPAAVGKVQSVSGNTITLTNIVNGGTTTTYTVDATNAKITKFTAGTGAKGTMTTITVSQIGVGDSLAVQGTANGTSITATQIMDGNMGFGMRGGRGPQNGGNWHKAPTPTPTGN